MEHPFFASLALRLQVKEDPGCHTAWTDGNVFAYNPRYINILSPEKLMGLAAHTVMHPACSHHKRRNNRDAKIWNQACDYVINPILIDAGLVLPDGFLFDEDYCGKSADAVYEILEQGSPEDVGTDENSKPEEDEKPDNYESSSGDQEESSLEEMEQELEDGEEADPGKSGEVRDIEQTDVDEDSLDIDWEEALVQAAANARGMGKLPGGLDLFVENRINPKLPWQELLARFIENSARSDYSWMMPNRRYLHMGLYFPSLQNQQLCEIAVAIDTSGSIKPEELEQFGAELSSILEMNSAKIHLLYCDTAINKYQTLERWDLPIVFEPKGGGGTDFRPVFEFLDNQQIQPGCLIFLTDLECRSFPDQSPAYPVLWVRTGDSSFVPPFGDLIQLD